MDKLSLNNIIQDTTYMKDYLTYQMMGAFGVDAPLCSYVYITVNGQDWGLYLAVEGVEDGFLRRNYGSDSGELYKPDSMSFRPRLSHSIARRILPKANAIAAVVPAAAWAATT